jgi:50S ribosomal protein L16 3-hydroxylase
MTYSLGFRAPRINDVLGRWLDALLERIDPELFYVDPVPLGQAAPGEIDRSSYAAALAQLKRTIAGIPVTPDWFGELVTEAGSERLSAEPSTSAGARVRLAPSARLAWRRSEDGLVVYANGATLQTTSEQQPALERLCAGSPVEVDCHGAQRALLLEMAELGCLQDG